MLDVKFVHENPELVIKKMSLRGIEINLDEFQQLINDKKALLQTVERLRNKLNEASKLIGMMKKEGKDAAASISEMKIVSDEIKQHEEKLREVERKIRDILLAVPNIPHESVPVGLCPEDNVEIHRVGKKPVFSFRPKPHWEIGRRLGILDFERAAKIAGSRFTVYFGYGARLERALINFMLDLHAKKHGYKEVIPPFVTNKESLFGTGNLPKFENDLFKLKGHSWYMIPTAEIPLTNLYRDEILETDMLPQRFVAYTPCFRREAGSYGKDIRGLVRQHQFNKVELVAFVKPEDSYSELDRLTTDAENILKRLGLHYRVVELCTGDLGFSGAKTYDLELWMPSRNGFLEISSCTNCEDFQARRANIRFRRSPNTKPEFVHTLNGSGVAIGRTVAAVLENYQQEDGSVIIPEVLRSYMDGCDRIS